MYQASQPMYQENWQQNYYTGYQPVEHSQQYYYHNNQYYNNYYNRSMSTSSSMDSLNPQYYYSHPVAGFSPGQDYHQIPSPEMFYFSHPVSPTYSPPQSPAYSSQPLTYSSMSPSYPSTTPYMNSNSFYPVQPMHYVTVIPTSHEPRKTRENDFEIGMKPSDRLQWIRKSLPKQATPTPESPQIPWETAAPVKPLRRPHTSTIKNNIK